MKTTSSKHENESRKASGLRKAVSVAGICLVGWGLWETANLFIGYKGSETTDDAQVEQYLSPVNVRVPGYIHRICFTEHQYVHRGDTLLIIEDDEYRIRLKEAEAALLDARSGRKAMGHTLNTVTSTASAYEASIAEAQFRVEQLEKDYRRCSALLEKKATTPIIVEQYQTQLEMARERVKGLKQQQNAAFSSVTEVGQRQENAEAAVMRAEAAVEMARLNLSYTVVLAPCDGYLGRRSMEEGQLVGAGQTVTTIIPETRKWIVANYKETQIASLSVGQEVEVTVDAFKGKIFRGRITAISSATGSKIFNDSHGQLGRKLCKDTATRTGAHRPRHIARRQPETGGRDDVRSKSRPIKLHCLYDQPK